MATAAVLTLPELLERVLAFLPPQDCLRGQRVSTVFRDVIRRSSSLQRSLFLKAEDDSSLRLVPKPREPGDLSHYASWTLRPFPEIEQERLRALTGLQDRRTVLKPAQVNLLTRLCYDNWKVRLNKRGDADGSLEIVQGGRCLVIDQWSSDSHAEGRTEWYEDWDPVPDEHILQVRLVFQDASEGQGEFPDASTRLPDCAESWQDMHLTQPPTQRATLQLLMTKACLADCFPPASVTYTEKINNINGIRLGQVIALLSEKLRDAGESVLEMDTHLYLHDVVDLTGQALRNAE